MGIDIVQEELIKRYIYIYENRKLILALCIHYGIERDYYKKRLKANKELIRKIKSQRLKITGKEEILPLLMGISYNLKKDMSEEKPYLFANVSDDVVNAYEEFLFTDENMEDTDLYKHIEALKNNADYLESFQKMIARLEERRQNNQWLKRVQTFTVWKILTYVKNKNKNNALVLAALDKYYNLDRYILTGINWESGYKLLESECDTKEEELDKFSCLTLIGEGSTGKQRSAIILSYPGNEFEKEDNYFAFEWSAEFEEQPSENYAKSNFMIVLANMPMLSEEVKSEIYKKIELSFKCKTKKLQM